jgi:heptosyltransferase-3
MNVDPAAIRRILVIRYRSIGDILLANPVLAALREAYPEATLDLLLDDVFVDVAAHNPSVDRVISHPRKVEGKRWKHDLACIRTIRAEKYDMVVDLQGGPRGAWLTMLSGAKVRVGHPFRLRNRLAYNVYGTHPAPDDHSWRVQFRMIENLGVVPPNEPTFFLHIDPAATMAIHDRLSRAGITMDRPLVLIHPGARIDVKRWPAEMMGALARWLVDERKAAVILAGAAADKEEIARIRRASGYALPASTDLTLPELAALIGGVDLMICNDSGPMHMAGVLGTPTVAFFGPSDPTIWHPVGTHNVLLTCSPMACMPCDQKGCPHEGNHCMTRIPLSQAQQAVDRLGALV